MQESLKILKPYLRGLPIIIGAMVIAVLLAKKYLNYVTPMYESTVKLKLADSNEGVPDNNLFKDMDVFTSSNKIGGEIEVLQSQVLLEKVFKNLDFDLQIKRVGAFKSVELYHNSPVCITYSHVAEKGYDRPFLLNIKDNQSYTIQVPGSKEMIEGKMGDTIALPLATFVISLNDTLIQALPTLHIVDQYQFEIISHQKLYSHVIQHLDITSVDKDIAVLRLSYKDANPIKAAAFINRLAEVYIQDYIETKYKAAHVTANFLDQQIESTVTKLTNAENQIQSYRDAQKITNIRQETETDLRKISQLKIQQTNTKMTLEAMQYLEQYIQNGKGRFLELAPNFEAFTDLLSTEMVKKIKALEAEKKDLLITYTQEDERVKVIDAKLADLTDYLAESITNTRKNVEIKYNNLNGDIEAAEKVFIGVPEKEKMLNILDREFQIYQQSYNFLNSKKIEADIAQAAKIAFHRIITPAQIAKEPVSPNRTIITIVSAILGMFSALMLIFIVHSMKAKVNDAETIESNSTIAVAMTTPKLKNETTEEKHFLKEVIQLELKGMIPLQGIFCVSAHRASEGGAYNALRIARALVMQGRKVLLIDAANQLKLATPSSTHPSTISPNLDYTTLTDLSFGRITQPGMAAYLDAYKKQYDMVLILNQTFDNENIAMLLMKMADVNMVVLDARLSPKKRIIETALLQDEFKIPAVYFLLNRHGYIPSVWRDCLHFFKKIIHKLLAKNRA